MSAYIVDHDHIDALITHAIVREVWYRANGNSIKITADNATEVGRILLDENERSVRYRYPRVAPDELPGTIGQDAAKYNFRPWGEPLESLVILKACDGLEYQCSETDDYQDSIAVNILNSIRKREISRLPDYYESPGWSLERSYS